LTHLGELFRGVITYHSYSQLILYPWGYTSQPIPDTSDLATMTKLAERMQELILGVHGTTYTPQQSSQLYLTAGDTTDWTYGEYGIPSFTIELRPDTPENGGFILPPDQIQLTVEENLAAALEFIERTL
jgi:carboxypeptidase T